MRTRNEQCSGLLERLALFHLTLPLRHLLEDLEHSAEEDGYVVDDVLRAIRRLLAVLVRDLNCHVWTVRVQGLHVPGD